MSGAGVARDGPRAAAAYDAMAADYAADAEDGPFNELYERPAVEALVGDVDGRHVLDAGCGPGILAERLAIRGATVTALDVSDEMVRLAAARLGSRARVRRADLADRLPWLGPTSFDVVVASLVLHYLRDWSVPLAEFRRVLRPGGRLVVSTHHPFAYRELATQPRYHAVELLEDEWVKGGRPYAVHFYHRPLSLVLNAVIAAGFVLDEVAEPLPDPSCADRFPEAHALLSTQPWFLFLAAHVPPARRD